MPARPRLRPVVAALLALPLALGASALPSAAAQPDHYVALGDSYAAGNGTGWPDLSLSCYRSSLAYAPLIAASRPNTSLSFRACSGADTTDVTGGQSAALTKRTDFVSVSVGGNDVGFTELIISCVNVWDEPLCRSAVETVNARIATELPAKLDAAYADIRARAPRAKVLVVGYPKPFGSDVSCAQADGVSATEAAMLNDVALRLDAVLAQRAAAARFTYVDPVEAFTGHDVCAPTPYVWGKVAAVFDVYHPTRAGHRDGFLPLVRAAMG